MKKFQFKSLTMRIWFIVTVIIIAIVSVVSIIFTFIFREFNEHKHQEILQYAHEIVLQSIEENTFNKNMINSINREGMHHFLFNKSNEDIHFFSRHEKPQDQVLLLWLISFIESDMKKEAHKSYKETLYDQTYLFEISHIKDELYLISYRELFVGEYFVFIVAIGFAIILLSLPISKVIASNIAKPLKQLEAYTRRIANKEWESDLHINSQDEIGRLAMAMYEMKQALKLADEEENKFLQSISHDLKTPVMVIMGYAQAIIDGVYVESPENTAMIIKNEAIRLEKKIKQVLYLNTLDYMLDNEKEKEDIYLDKLLTYLVQNFQSVNTDLSWQLNINTKPAVIAGNPDRIRVSIENILENQLRFADKNIQVSLEDNGASWKMEIMNDGPLLPDKDLKQIFNSLYKGDNGNFGLGLAISQKIIQYYRGSIQVENKDNHVCFTINYPKR